MNESNSPARTLVLSDSRLPAVSVYPDSDKIGGLARRSRDLIFVRDSAGPWSHGEEGWDNAD